MTGLRAGRGHTFSVVLAFVGVVIASPAHLASQSTDRRIDDEHPCRTCTIEVTKVTSLGSISDPFSLDGFLSVVQDRRGRYFVVAGPSSEIGSYDSHGRFLGVLGRRGQGPGEFMGVFHLLIGPADSLSAFDLATNRATIFSPEGSFIRAFRVPTAGYHAIRLSSGDFLISGTIYTAEGIGWPIHRVSPDGGLIRSFGVHAPRMDPRRPSASRRLMALDGKRLWTVRPDRYEIEMWDLDGEFHRRLDRETDWFPKREQELSGPVGKIKPEPWIKGIRMDADGRLWVAVVVAAADWESVLQKGARGVARFARARDAYDTIIEVIDPTTSQLITSARLPEYVDGFAADQLVFSHRESNTGAVLVDIWRLNLRNPSPKEVR